MSLSTTNGVIIVCFMQSSTSSSVRYFRTFLRTQLKMKSKHCKLVAEKKTFYFTFEKAFVRKIFCYCVCGTVMLFWGTFMCIKRLKDRITSATVNRTNKRQNVTSPCTLCVTSMWRCCEQISVVVFWYLYGAGPAGQQLVLC